MKKRFYSLLLALLLLTAALSVPSLAAGDALIEILPDDDVAALFSDDDDISTEYDEDILTLFGDDDETPDEEDAHQSAPSYGGPLSDAADDTEIPYVLDFADILTDEQEARLAEAAMPLTEAYGCSVHVGTVADMREYGYYNIESFAESFFDSNGLGVGPERTGILLLLSMADRDYDIDAHGSFAHYAFTDYGKTTISDRFLDNFRENDWFGGFADYIDRCGEMLRLAQDDEPVDIPVAPEPELGRLTGGGLIITGALSALIAWLVCSMMKNRHRSVFTAVDAHRYVPYGEVDMRIREDRFTHATETRRRIERNPDRGGGHSGGGGTTISSGGHSHSSGKF